MYTRRLQDKTRVYGAKYTLKNKCIQITKLMFLLPANHVAPWGLNHIIINFPDILLAEECTSRERLPTDGVPAEVLAFLRLEL